MSRSYRHFRVQTDGDVSCVSLLAPHLDEPAVREMSDDAEGLITDGGCRKLVFTLGRINCPHSVLIARLIKLRRTMAAHGGRLKLCDVSPEAMNVFRSCQLHDYFDFAPNVASAMAAFHQRPSGDARHA